MPNAQNIRGKRNRVRPSESNGGGGVKDSVQTSLDHLCGAVFIHIQEIEESAVLLVPAALKRKLQILVNGRPLEYLVTLLGTELKKEPSCLQCVAYIRIPGELKFNLDDTEQRTAERREGGREDPVTVPPPLNAN